MTAQRLDGTALHQRLKKKISEQIAQRQDNALPRPGLAVILVGDNPASESYVQHKEAACKSVGMASHCHRLPSTTTTLDIKNLINQLNADDSVHGILLQLPLPEHIETAFLLEQIDINKDVDGFHPYNLGRLMQRRPHLRPCTPYGIIQLLQHHDITIEKKHAVIVGASNIVGRPMALELLMQKCTVTICHRFTPDLKIPVTAADILVSAIGKPNIIKSEWIKPGAIVVDVGFSRLADGQITGDIHFDTAEKKAQWITPVPGGVGPMTVITLLQNTLQAACIQDTR